MLYSSSLGLDKDKTFFEIVNRGLANDGGLYIPNQMPKISAKEIRSLASKSLAYVTAYIFNIFDQNYFSFDEYKEMSNSAFASFTHPAKAPILELEQRLYLLDLTLGKSLSFKDYAMSMLGQILSKIALRQKKSLSVLVATSGDTGSAAIQALKEINNIKIFVLFPKSGISEFQRKQMTSTNQTNVYPIAIDGSFDDCQKIVKEVFSDLDFSLKYNLIAVNSINWARIISQTSYYVYTCLKFNQQKINYLVPSGNFGNIYAGFLAKKLGLNINKLICACNSNDVIDRLFKLNSLDKNEVVKTFAPSMDIQIPSNFERYLTYLFNHKSSRIREFLDKPIEISTDKTKLRNSKNNLKQTKKNTLNRNELQKFRKDFLTTSANDSEILDTIKATYQTKNIVIDPHTSCAIKAYNDYKTDIQDCVNIALATAHPAKFQSTIKKAINKKIDLPVFFSFATMSENFLVLKPNTKTIKKLIITKNK